MTHSARPPSPESLLAHREWMRAIARHLVADENAVDDIEQRTWLVAMRNRRPVTSIRGWLRRVVNSAAVDQHRETSRRRAREEAVARPEALPPTEHLVAQADAQRAVAAAVTALPEPYRTTVLLRYFEELSVADVAVRMGVPLETVRTRLQRAHARLREDLDRDFGDRRAWCVLLLPLTRTRPPIPIGAATAGALAMAGKTKLVAVVVAVLMLTAGVWWAADEATPTGRDAATKDVASAPTSAVSPRAKTKQPDAPPPVLAGFVVGVDVVDSAERPVAGARVEFTKDVADPAAYDTDWYLRLAPRVAASRSATTSAAGAADVSGLAVGEWRMRVSAVGFAEQDERVVVSAGVPRRRVTLRAGFALLGRVLRPDGSPAAGADVFVDARRGTAAADGSFRVDGLVSGVRSVRAGSAGGLIQEFAQVCIPDVREVTLRLRGGCALRGRVVDDETDAPIAGARVVFRATVIAELPRQLGFGAQTTSGADGAFAFDDLPSGTPYHLWALRDGWVACRDGLAAQPPNFRLAPGVASSLEVRMSRGGAVRGRVLRSDGTPVAGALVDVLTHVGPVAIGISEAVVSGEDGEFRATAKPGVAMVRVKAPGAKQRDFPSSDPWTPVRNEQIPAACKVTVSATQEAAIDVVVDVVPVGRGVLAGVARREDGSPAAGVALELLPAKWSEDTARSVACGPGGAFAFTGLSGSKYVLRATAAGCAPVRVEGLVLPESGRLDGVDVVLPREATIAGRIVDESGVPVAGAELSVRADGSNSRDGPTVATSAADGAFVVGRLTAGKWTVRATSPGLVSRETTVAAGADDVEFKLERSLSITGVVVDAASGEPVAGVFVQGSYSLYRVGDMVYRDAASDAAGRFTLSDLRPDTYTLWVGPSYAEGEYVGTSVERVKAGDAAVRIAVKRGLAIEGRVLDDAGRPVGGVVGAYGPKSGGAPGVQARSARLRRDGSFRLAGLAPGGYDVAATPTDFAGNEMSPVRVADVQAGAKDVVLVASAGLRIEGRLLLEDGKPLPSGPGYIEVRAKRPDGGVKSSMQLSFWGVDGSFKTQTLDPDALYDVVVTQVPGRLGGAVRGVRAGTKGVDVIVRTGGRIEGRVVDGSGAPARAAVNASAVGAGTYPPEPGAQTCVASDVDGRFVLTGLDDRPYRLSVGGPGCGFVATSPAESVSPGATGVEIRVERGVVAAGRLVDTKGAPRKGGYVTLRDEGGAQIQVDENGRFSIDGLKPGPHRLSAWTVTKMVDLGEVTAPATGLELVVRDE